MKEMGTRKFWSLHKMVKLGDILLVPQDKNTPPSKFDLPDVYEVKVLDKTDSSFRTDFVKEGISQPLTWNENYNFLGTKIKK